MPKSEEKCLQIRKETKEKILKQSMVYFARNGFSATKISDLSRYIGIGQGTLYQYFSSKEDLYCEIIFKINDDQEVKDLKLLALLPISAKKKIQMLCESILNRLINEESYAAKVTLNTQRMFDEDYSSSQTVYTSKVYQYTKKIIEQGQREKIVVNGDSLKLTDYFWSIVYLYSLKTQFTKDFLMISKEDLERVLLKDGD